ncbi:helix-turn-helix domain-containing protein [Fulvimarina sp. 2208YS6-2-32]|uniref:Helix-turn-helix domain-containing protein n=1 Tax=Fulvimarina uroteuthidis TaxID=3098149 RepID=A0ABU5I292_9HYPH|nr:helix-turn-helix domain-containing protein [Fulvimarina sp. 2208YS6-2-32]MDY8108276.1 helix-turn-helix domain-containing protein [Fulvimarina sp. 2208YS6-2-32]
MGIAAYSSFTNRSIHRARLAIERHEEPELDPEPNPEDRFSEFHPLAPHRPTMCKIMLRICRETGVSVQEMKGPTSNQRVCLARHAFFYWAVRLTDKSLRQIAEYCGRKDHTTVWSGIIRYPIRRAKGGRYVRPLR